MMQNQTNTNTKEKETRAEQVNSQKVIELDNLVASNVEDDTNTAGKAGSSSKTPVQVVEVGDIFQNAVDVDDGEGMEYNIELVSKVGDLSLRQTNSLKAKRDK